MAKKYKLQNEKLNDEQNQNIDSITDVEQINENSLGISTTEELNNENLKENIEKGDEMVNSPQPSFITVNIKLDRNAIQVDQIISATGQKDKLVASNGELSLILGRLYYIPVDCDESLDTDSKYLIKIFSDISDQVDVRFVKNGVACIVPLRHNIRLKNKQRLCVIY